MTHIFKKRAQWDRRKASWVLVAMMLVAPLAVWSLKQIDLENDVQNWLPADDARAKTLQWYLHHFGHEDRILVAWEGSSLDDPRVARFAEKLRGVADDDPARGRGLKLIGSIATPQETIALMVKSGVEPEEAVRRLQGVLIGTGPDAAVALSITLSKAGEANKAPTIRAIRQAAEEVGIDPNSLHMGGSPVIGLALNQEVLKAAWNPDAPLSHLYQRSVLLLSSVVGIVLVFVMLRSFHLATSVLIVSFYTTLLAVALVPVTGGSMNMVLVVMPPLLMVLTISGAIHVANYWKHATHTDPRTAVVEASRMARQPCFLASVTTAAGLLSLATSSLTPVRDFGLYSAVGCLIGLVMILYGLPALLQLWPSKPPKAAPVEVNRRERSGWQQWGRFLSAHRRPVIVACVVLLVLGTSGLKWFRTETKVIRYFPEDSRIVQDYRFLEEHLAGVIPVEIVVRFNEDSQSELNFLERMEVVREVESKIRRHSEISGALSLADFLPVYTPVPENAARLRKLLDHKKAHETERRIKEHKPVAGLFLATAQESADLNSDGQERLAKAGDELWRISSQVALLSDVNYTDLTNDLDRIAESVLGDHPGTGYVVTGMVPVFLRTQQAVLESLIRSFALALGVIGVVMMIVLKNPFSGMMAMLPNVLPICLVFGFISWWGLSVDIGTMITAAVALGIAVDGTLHLLAWFRSGIARGLTRPGAVARALAHCGPAMCQTSLIVGVGLLMLYPSQLLLIRRFGWLMAALIGAALLADLIFLPALLAGPLGRLLQKSTLLAHQATAGRQRALSLDPRVKVGMSQDSELSNPRSHCRNGLTRS